MRYLVVLSLCSLIVSPQVHACRNPMSQTTLFFETIPSPQPAADLIARVSLSEVNETMGLGMATATVIEVLRTSDAKIHQGDKITMKYQATSCGPAHKNGDNGVIIARTGADIHGHLVLYPYEHDYRGRIRPPSSETFQ